MKNITFLFQKVLLLLVVLLTTSSLLAEGSKDLYPAGATGGRAAIVSGASNPASWPFATEGDHYVYAEVGDVITIASSLQSLGTSTAQRVKLFNPFGVEISLTINAGEGNILNRAAEIAGPKKPGHTAVGDEYNALEYTVQAGEEGIFKVQFLGTASNTSSGRKTHSADEEWAPQFNSTPYIQAWDVSVFNIVTDNWIEGRVYVNVFNLAIWTMGKTNPYVGGFESEVKVLTKDGFVYNVDNNGQNGIWFTFYVNNKGFYDGANQTPLYKSVTGSSNISTKSHDPRSPDANGNITHKIFYNIHDQSMPKNAIGGPTPGQPTWLNPDRVLITISNVGAVGLEGTPGQMSQKGGYVVFDSDANGGYKITISPAPGSAPFEPRILSGVANAGHNDIYFDGLDGNGVPIPDDAEMGLDVKPQGAEVHFPYIDVEVNPDGLIIQLLTDDLLGVESDIIYWNDEDLSDTGDGPSSPKNNSHLKTPPGGVSSALGEHKWGQSYNFATGNASGTGTFGDDRGIDTWTFVEGTTISSSSSFQVMIADLSIEELIADKIDCELIEGDRVTYTIRAKNNGPKDVDSTTFVFKLPTGFTDGAAITFNGNGCGVEKTGYELAYSSGTYRSVLDLPDGCEVTYTIEAVVGANTDANSLAEASIIRPKDVTDPDATNPALDDGAGGAYIPSDAHEECSNNETPTTPTPQYPYGCNNIMEINLTVTPSLTVVNTIDPTECDGEGSVEFSFTNVPDGIYDIVYDGGVWSDVEVSNGAVTIPVSEGVYNNIKISNGGCLSPNGVNTSLEDPANPAAATASVTVQPSCDELATIEITAPLGDYTYSIDGVNYFEDPIFTDVEGDESYTITVKDTISTCETSGTIVIVDAAPSIPDVATASVTVQPTCNDLATIVITAPLGDYTYSIDGGAFQPETTFTNVDGGPHTITVKDDNSSCESASVNVIVDDVPNTPNAATASVTAQPTCVNDGTISITAPLGGYTYSIDGTNYFADPVFTDVSSGPYTITVKDDISSCVSAGANVTVDNIPSNPDAPTASVTQQPTCEVLGVIEVTSPLGSEYEYSINGTVFQEDEEFSGVSVGTYTVTVRDINTRCESTGSIVEVNEIPNSPDAPTVVLTQLSCDIALGSIEITNPTTGYEYSNDGGVSFQSSTIFENLDPGDYSIIIKDLVTACVSDALDITIHPVPANPDAPTLNVIQPNCDNILGTVEVTNPTTGFEFSIDGGVSFQSSVVFENLVPGDYSIIIKDLITSCVSPVTDLTINPVPANPDAPVASVTQQPTCAVLSVIEVTEPLGSEYEYSIDGIVFQEEKIFTGVSDGTYTVIVRDVNTRCETSGSVVEVNEVPGAPSAPDASVTVQPSCEVLLGTIEITAPLGDYEYSINGGTNYQDETLFTDLDPATYTVTVRNKATNCISAGTNVIVNEVPANPDAPTASVTVHPTCEVSGTIVVTEPLGSEYEYSIDGLTYQTDPEFTDVDPGTYSVIVKNVNTKCVSSSVDVVVNPVPANPDAPTADATVHPTCEVLGTIVVTEPLGNDYEYSIDGVSYQTNPEFNDLEPGTYSVSIKDVNTECVSSSVDVTLDAIPDAPDAPTVSVTQQPTCDVSGIIEVSAPLGTDYEYSIDGSTYQVSPVFTNVTSGDYTVTVKDINTGCESSGVNVTVDAILNAPDAPTVAVTQPTCEISGGIEVTAPLGSEYEYSIDGTTYQANTVFTDVLPGTYMITVRETTANCVSEGVEVTVNPLPDNPNAPSLSVTQHPTCDVLGTIEVTAPLGVEYEYSIDGIAYQANTIFTDVEAGDYTVTVTNINTGCESENIDVTVNAVPNAPSTPVASVTVQPTCDVLGTIEVTAPLGSEYEYSLDGEVYQSNPLFTDVEPGTYFISVIDLNTGCESAVSEISVNKKPVNCDLDPSNAFTPDGDGINDKWVIHGIENFPNNHLTIYNRWGNVVYSADGYLNDWEGTTNSTMKIGGEDLPTGTYFYVLDTKDEEVGTVKGYVYIQR